MIPSNEFDTPPVLKIMLRRIHSACLMTFLLGMLPLAVLSDDPDSGLELTNFAFANYLGSVIAAEIGPRQVAIRHLTGQAL